MLDDQKAKLDEVEHDDQHAAAQAIEQAWMSICFFGTVRIITSRASPKKLVDTTAARFYTPKNLGDIMARPKTDKKTDNLTPLELEIMHVLWETGPANVQTVQQALKRELAYTTVQTMLNILERKGKAKRTLKNRAYFYKPAVSRKQVIGKHVNDVVERLLADPRKAW
jgi:predicted transcriptional regulator